MLPDMLRQPLILTFFKTPVVGNIHPQQLLYYRLVIEDPMHIRPPTGSRKPVSIRLVSFRNGEIQRPRRHPCSHGLPHMDLIPLAKRPFFSSEPKPPPH